MFWGRGALQGMAGVGRGGQAFADSEGVSRHWWASEGRSQRSGSAPAMLLAALFFFIFFPPEQLSEVSFYSPASVCLHWDPRILHWSIFTTSEARRKP